MTIDDIVRMAREAWVFPEAHIPNILEFANLVAAAEREACAALLDEMAAADKLTNYYKVAALRIRERGAP
jgi:hypothetical protein